MNRHLSFFIGMNFLRRFDSFYPLFVLIAAYYHISIAQVFVLEAVFALSMIFSEIPSGHYSDQNNRANTLLFGCCMFCVACFLFVTWPNMWCWLLAQVACGIAFACFNGTDTALLYEWSHHDKTRSYLQLESSVQAWSRLAEGISALLGALVMLLHPRLPIITMLASKLIMTLYAYRMLKGKKHTKTQVTSSNMSRSRKSMKEQCANFFRMLNTHHLWELLICSSILNCVLFVMYWILQTELLSLGVGMIETGIFWFAFFVCAGLASLLTGKIRSVQSANTNPERHVLTLYLFMLLLIGCILWKPMASLWCLSGFALVTGIKLPLMNVLINEQIPCSSRATFHSIDSVLTRLLFAGSMTTTGAWIESPMKSWLWIGLLIVTLTGFLCALRLQKKSSKHVSQLR